MLLFTSRISWQIIHRGPTPIRYTNLKTALTSIYLAVQQTDKKYECKQNKDRVAIRGQHWSLASSYSTVQSVNSD